MTNQSSIDKEETYKFALLKNDWWNEAGPLKTLHHINPIRLEFVKSHCDLNGKSILDIGCGGGIFAESLSASGAKVLGIDAEQSAIDIAIAHAKSRTLELEYACMPVENCSQGPFDMITCMELLEHVPEPNLVLEKACALLKPGGYFFLSTINRTVRAYVEAIIAAEYMFRLLPKQTHDYDKFLKPSEIAHSLKALGMKLIALRGMSYNPLKGQAALVSDVSVNYLMAWSRVC